MGCCHAARQEKQEKRPRSTTPSSTTVRDAAVSLSLAASSRPFEECVCGSCWYIIQYRYIPPNKAILSIVWDSTPCTQVPRSRHTAPTLPHTRRTNRRANGTHAAHRDARQRPMQHRATLDSRRLEVGGSLHSSGGRRSSARCRGCKGVQAATTAKLARGELVGQTGEGEGS